MNIFTISAIWTLKSLWSLIKHTQTVSLNYENKDTISVIIPSTNTAQLRANTSIKSFKRLILIFDLVYSCHCNFIDQIRLFVETWSVFHSLIWRILTSISAISVHRFYLRLFRNVFESIYDLVLAFSSSEKEDLFLYCLSFWTSIVWLFFPSATYWVQFSNLLNRSILFIAVQIFFTSTMNSFKSVCWHLQIVSHWCTYTLSFTIGVLKEAFKFLNTVSNVFILLIFSSSDPFAIWTRSFYLTSW